MASIYADYDAAIDACRLALALIEAHGLDSLDDGKPTEAAKVLRKVIAASDKHD